MPPNICVGCGFEVDALGVLHHKGIVSTEWPYTGADPRFPLADIATSNGMRCDPVTGNMWSRPSSVADMLAAATSLIGATAGLNGTDFWSLDSDDFGGGNPWNDTGAEFDLSTLATITLTNPSAVRPAVVLMSVEIGPQAASIDANVDLETYVVGNVWDGLGVPYPGDLPIGRRVRWFGSSGVGDPNYFDTTGKQSIIIPRSVGAGAGYFGTYLAGGATQNFAAKLVGVMAAGTATNMDGQFFQIGGPPVITMRLWSA